MCGHAVGAVLALWRKGVVFPKEGGRYAEGRKEADWM